jgi:cell division protein FtsB
MADWADVGIKVGTVVLGLAGGWVGAAIRFGKRLATVEERHKTFDSMHVSIDLRLSKEIQRLEQLITDEQQRIADLKDSSHDFAKDAEFAQYIAEQQKKWEALQYTLGRIESLLKIERKP